MDSKTLCSADTKYKTQLTTNVNNQYSFIGGNGIRLLSFQTRSYVAYIQSKRLAYLCKEHYLLGSNRMLNMNWTEWNWKEWEEEEGKAIWGDDFFSATHSMYWMKILKETYPKHKFPLF